MEKMNKSKFAQATVCEVNGGWGIKVNGLTILSTSGSPFKSQETAERGINYYRWKRNDDRFLKKNAPSLSLESTRPDDNCYIHDTCQPIAPLNCVQHSSFESTLDVIGHSPAEKAKYVGMSDSYFCEVQKLYGTIVLNFNHDQICMLNTLLGRYSNALDMQELLHKEQIRNAGYDHRQSWKYGKNKQAVGIDELEEELRNS